jgi:hypothetical protein
MCKKKKKELVERPSYGGGNKRKNKKENSAQLERKKRKFLLSKRRTLALYAGERFGWGLNKKQLELRKTSTHIWGGGSVDMNLQALLTKISIMQLP